MKALLNYFSSVKLAIVLLIIITLASILGTLVPQHRSEAEYAARYGQLSGLLIRLEVTRLYQSFWYIALLFLFALNTVVCTLTRLTPKLRRAFRPQVETEKKRILGLNFKDSFRRKGEPDTLQDESRELLRSKHYKILESENAGQRFLLARKKVFGFFGSDVVHLGLLIILLGGIFSGIWGIRRDLTLSEGDILPIAESDFSLRLDKFATEYWPNGSIRDWKSTITVIENETDLFNKVIEVNHPLSYKGFVFYQSSYGWDWEDPILQVWTKKKSDPAFLEKRSLRIGQKVMLSDETTEILVTHFLPDFVIGENNVATSRSRSPNNPAILIEGWRGEGKVFSSWVFAKFPDFSQMHEGQETDYIFELKDFTAPQYSGIQMAHDPGVNLIWVGCAFLMLGLMLAFFWPPREIRIILEEDQGKTQVHIGGIAAKNKDTFETEFAAIVKELGSKK
jgi:cytochrome c biogenesis protein